MTLNPTIKSKLEELARQCYQPNITIKNKIKYNNNAFQIINEQQGELRQAYAKYFLTQRLIHEQKNYPTP